MLTACTWWVVECRAGGAKIERGPEPAVTPSGSRTAGLLGNVLRCIRREERGAVEGCTTRSIPQPITDPAQCKANKS